LTSTAPILYYKGVVRIALLVCLVSLVWAATGTAAPGARVTMITDSVGGALYWNSGPRDVLAEHYDLVLDTKTCRKLAAPGCPAYGDDAPESALAAVQRIGSQLGRTVVVDVGYNDRADTYASGLDEVMRALVGAGVQHVIWVTLEETEGVWSEIDAAIRGAPQRWPQLTVADWAASSAGQDWFVDDAHLNWLGAAALAAFLRPYLLAVSPLPPLYCGSPVISAFCVRGL
jgi:hypothetical protein